MKQEWLNFCLKLSSKKADYYIGARKILRSRSLVFEEINSSLQMSDAGYTANKVAHLRRNYLHEESRRVAQELWVRRLNSTKPGSVGFTTYNHFIKNNPDTASKISSVMGPCIQSVCLSRLSNGNAAVDVFYRTTELFKKFPADLVFIRDVLLEGFDLQAESLTCHFANITLHPMYFVGLIPLIDDPLAEFRRLASLDTKFHSLLVRWTARYLCDSHYRSIAKFAQARRVYTTARERITGNQLAELQDYLLSHLSPSLSVEEPDDDYDD